MWNKEWFQEQRWSGWGWSGENRGRKNLINLNFEKNPKLFQGMEAQGLCIESNKKHRKKKFLIKKDAWFKKKFLNYIPEYIPISSIVYF